MNLDELAERLPAVDHFQNADALDYEDGDRISLAVAEAAIRACLDEINHLEEFTDKLADFAAASVEAGSGYMCEIEKWEWVARQYELFCASHAWLPTISYLIEQFEAIRGNDETFKNIEESLEEPAQYHKQTTPKFEE
jgi:hypothetical protein